MPESKGVTAGTGNTFERTGRRGPGPRAAREGAADGTYRTFEPLPGPPPPGCPPRRRGGAGLPRRSPPVIGPGGGARPTSIAGWPGVAGPSAAPARPPRGMQGGGATFGATVGVAAVNPPFRYDFRYPATANVVPESRWRRCGSSPAGESTLRLWGVEWGWERPPSDPRIYGPDTRSRATTSATGRGSLPARACGAINPCGKASGPACGGSRRRPAEPP